MIKLTRILYAVILVFGFTRVSWAQVSVLTYHNDNFRSGVNTNETALTPTTITSNTFGRLFSRNLDGAVYAQPLVAGGLNIGGKQRNLVFVATEHDTVYAFDGEKGRRYWRTKLLPRRGFTVSTNDVQCEDLVPEIGITSTPVIDPSSRTIYVLAKCRTNSVVIQQLHALDLVTGKEKLGGPVTINATAPGNGDGNVNGVITFDPLRNHQRAALLLANGIVYIAWASHCDQGTYHGWIMGYNPATLQQSAVFSVTPDGSEGGIWESGCGLSADASGNLFCSTGNGTFDADTGGHNLGDSILRLNTGLAVQDYFTPFNQASLSAQDNDLGSGGVLLLPDQPGAHPHLAITGSKQNKLYVVDRDDLGHFNSGGDSQIVQSFSGVGGSLFSTPVCFQGLLYCGGVDNPLKAFALTNGQLSSDPISQSDNTFGYPGTTPSISANGTSNAIVWALQTDGFETNGPAILHAYDANDLTHELFAATGLRQSPGPAVKFTVPTVANGRVYVGAVKKLAVYGLR